MNPHLLFLLAVALSGASPSSTTLIAGAVRDQRGAPIADAQVEALPRSSAPATTRTATDGTFAFEASDAREVRISCTFCATQTVSVAADGTVVAIVRRYLALQGNGPSPQDIAALPYARVESDLSLTPFTMLVDSSRALPGPQVSDRGASPDGGLLVDGGIPNYDIVANLSPFYTLPQHYENAANTVDSSEAYRYGDVAGGGTFVVNPDDSNAGATLAGSDTVARASTGDALLSGSIGYSSDTSGQQARADIAESLSAPQTTTHFSLLDSRAQDTFDDNDLLTSTFSGARVDVDRSGPVAIDSSLTVDRGEYDLDTPYALDSAAWTDVDARVDIHSNATVAPFALLAVRQSSGFLDSNQPDASTANTLGQAQMQVGIRLHEASLDGTVAYGDDDASYAGGYPGAHPSSALAHDAIAKLDYHPSARWSVAGSDSSSFRLPTFIELSEYTPDNSVVLDLASTLEGTVEYSDASRLRFGITALSQRTTGFEHGTLASVGSSVAWQVAPKISARAWLMRVTPDEIVALPVAYFGAMPRPATVGSGWITYDNDGGLRLDAIWRQDLMDWDPNAHLDASASGPLTQRLRWYVSTEKRDFSRHIDLGLRW